MRLINTLETETGAFLVSRSRSECGDPQKGADSRTRRGEGGERRRRRRLGSR